jgi:hypothetical protein
MALNLNPELGVAYTGRGLAQVMLGQTADAIMDAEEALARKPAHAEMMHNIACIFAQASKQSEEGRGAMLRRRAIDTIAQTLAMVPERERAAFWRDKTMTDPALAPLHDDVNFQRLGNDISVQIKPESRTER